MDTPDGTVEPRLAPAARFSLAGRKDEESVLELMREFYPGEGLSYRDDIARSGLEALWRQPALGGVCLIHAGDELAGYAVLAFGFSLEFHGRDALVDELYVRERFRGLGYGTACLAWLEELCASEGVRAIHLEVDNENARAQRLYNRLGYRDHDRHLLTKWLTTAPEP